MIVRGLLLALLLFTASPQEQQRFPVHVESLEYPLVARNARITGDVVIVAEIDAGGHVSIPSAPTGHPLLSKAAEENVKTWRFQSGRESEMRITYHFKLDDNVKPTNYYQTRTAVDLPDSVTVVAPFPQVETNYSSSQKSNRQK